MPRKANTHKLLFYIPLQEMSIAPLYKMLYPKKRQMKHLCFVKYRKQKITKYVLFYVCGRINV